MLFCKYCCRCYKCHLLIIFYCLEGRPHCNFSFSVSYISTDNSVHNSRAFHIFLDIPDCLFLIFSFLKWKQCLKFFLPHCILLIYKSVLALSLSLYFNKFCSKFFNIFSQFLSFPFKPSCPEFIKFRLLTIRYIFFKPVQFFNRNIEDIFISILYFQVICSVHSLYSLVNSHSILDMDNIVIFKYLICLLVFYAFIYFSFLLINIPVKLPVSKDKGIFNDKSFKQFIIYYIYLLFIIYFPVIFQFFCIIFSVKLNFFSF